MNTNLTLQIGEDLKKSFQKLLLNTSFPSPVNDIAKAINEGFLNREILSEILLKHSIKNTEDLKIGILDMLLSYINLILNDNFITVPEADNVRYLKRFFKIKEGDFYNRKYYEIEKILDRQFENMYQNNVIDNEEALQRVELQELFDLSYDQFLKLSAKAVKSALARGADPMHLDTFINAIVK